MVSSKGPAEKFGLRSPSSSNLESVSCNELMVLEENAGGSLTDDVRKLYLNKKKQTGRKSRDNKETRVTVVTPFITRNRVLFKFRILCPRNIDQVC